MTVIDTELPDALIDLLLALTVTVMGAVLMCLSAGYFAATMPFTILIVWGESGMPPIFGATADSHNTSITEVLPQN